METWEECCPKWSFSLTLSEIPWRFSSILPNVKISLTHCKIPWQFPDLEKFYFSLTFPWRLWTLLTAPEVSRPLQLVLSGGPVTPTPIGEYNGLRGENRGPFKGQQASASNPVMWLWLAGLYVREALPHMLPATRYPATSWPTIPRGYSTAPQPVHTGRRPGSDCGLACWTMNPGSGQSYCSFNSHTISNSALVKYNLRASGWKHSTKLYPNIKICVHHILEQLVGITNNFVCISVN